MKIIDIVKVAKPVEMHSALKTGEVEIKKDKLEISSKSSLASGTNSNQMNTQFADLVRWASKSYQISDDLRDYVIVPVPTIITDTPNKNGVAFPAKSLASFSPNMGMPYFKSWVGKPTFFEHKNDNIAEAKGIILDSVMNPIRAFPGFWKVVKLLAFDRTKDPVLYDRIVSGAINSYSMGCYASYYSCSICGAKYKAGAKFAGCSHIDIDKLNFYVDNSGRFAFKQIWEIEGFETSAVAEPAFRPAVSDFPSVLDPLIKAKT